MVDVIQTDDGVERILGCLLPPQGFVTSFPALEDAVPVISARDIEEIARSGDMDGRKKFDASFIKDQRSHGSCNGFAGAAALTRARVRRRLPRVDLSGAYLYSLINGGQDRGSLLEDGMRVMQTKGIATEQTVGWDAIYPSRYNREKADAEAAQFKAFECYAVKTKEGFWTALALNFDIVLAVHVGSRFMRVDSQGIAGVDSGPGNHAVGADGITWGNDQPLATAYNSWNLSYGDQGRMLLTWSHLSQPWGYHTTYAIRSTLDGNGDNPPAAKE